MVMKSAHVDIPTLLSLHSSSSLLSLHSTETSLFSTPASLSFSILSNRYCMTANLLTLNSSKTKFLFVGLPQQLDKINTSSLITTHSARNLGFIFDEHLTFSDQISALFKSCYYHIRELRSIRLYLDFKTASAIATSVVHSTLDYCNSLYYNLPQSQIKKTPQHSELSCSCCHQNAKIFSHHSCT